ncbi:uncharacterized protein LOC136072342 [Hydra vulgaris]|uniref:uncharacterized protein LOC136072342 n=1 Tax=Hydra vulgaris TaxID=6087 RepID=UPI0032EA7779
MDINMIEYKPLKDNECFKWCAARFFNTKEKNSERVDKDLKEQANKLNWEKIEFPVSLHQNTQFEKNNQNISVNVFGYESLVYPLQISENKNRQHQMDLLLISNDETNHYCLIKNLSRLLSSQTSKNEHEMFYCRNCLLGFSTEESLYKHKLYCDVHNSVRIELPEPNTMIKFNHLKKIMRVPFVDYADFESFITPINTCTPNPNESYTKQYQRHTPSSFCYYIKCFNESVYQYDICHICDNCEEELKDDRVKDHCHITGNDLDLLLRKGVYPYEWVDSIDNDEDYSHAQTVWKDFYCKTFRDYHNLYSVSDVLLLIADVFENFRDVCMKNYKLDPAWYYTSPGLAWDAALKETKIELESLSDYDMILMIKQGIRGGIIMISNRLETANNKYMETYDESKESKYIQYLDANNLYRWAMSKPLPTHGFQWMSKEELKKWKSISCIVEVDLEYPEHLHDLHNDYPLAPEKLKIDSFYGSSGSKVKKLVPNLNNKKNYIIHYENLKLYERLGLKIIKFNRGIKFEESAWLSKYIELNTNLLIKATNDFEKDFFKLMNNSVFGKTMENIENRVDVRLITKSEEAIKLASKPNYESRTIFDENLIAIHMKRTKLTDSLAFEIKIKDFYSDISNDVERLNKKELGKFKDEAGGAQIEEFEGLRSKLYSYKVHGEDKKKCKGVKKNVVEKYITHEDYKDCLLSRRDQMRKMNVIRSHLLDVYTEEINKIALSAEDDKRII